jgi:hypothetical protein
MRRHIDRDNLIILAISPKFGGVVAFVAIEDQEIIVTI